MAGTINIKVGKHIYYSQWQALGMYRLWGSKGHGYMVIK